MFYLNDYIFLFLQPQYTTVFLIMPEYMLSNKILCFGEILLRIQANSDGFIKEKGSVVNIYLGGSELNVAAKLSKLGLNSSILSALPKNDISDRIINLLKKEGVDSSKLLYRHGNLGSYFLLSPNGLSSGDVIYDRSYSSFSQLKKSEIDWDIVFSDVSWFHFSALTISLSQNLADVCEEAVLEAYKRGVTISVDLNYRSRLWQYGKKPNDVMPKFVQYANVIMGNVWASNIMLKTSLDITITSSTDKKEMVRVATTSAYEIFQKYPLCKHVANTYRFMNNNNHNKFFGTYHNREDNVFSETYESFQIVDRIGSGDAFMAGLIYAIFNKSDNQMTVDLSTKCGFEKLFIGGDF